MGYGIVCMDRPRTVILKYKLSMITIHRTRKYVGAMLSTRVVVINSRLSSIRGTKAGDEDPCCILKLQLLIFNIWSQLNKSLKCSCYVLRNMSVK